jgi:hypothetical protein
MWQIRDQRKITIVGFYGLPERTNRKKVLSLEGRFRETEKGHLWGQLQPIQPSC